ncbi:hypothetical protein PsorP6_009297 [Peronosclerospora sorghi]|uniref:Uncharacterized protein n=1 Tax=Peronosclerospora sorghi TaxID=230839 RepID=A0ACC0W257_9STRA|nr:hypothetical protein PsorP6_009297 [Peronosclerospora sorghi]
MDIARIVDRKIIKKRVHYLVVWKGFGEENNTWESRVDLIADGYSNVIKAFEEHRKHEAEEMTSRGRSPGRLASKSPRNSKSPSTAGAGRSPSRRSRSRSASVSRKLPWSDRDEEKHRNELETVHTRSSTTTRPRKSLKADEKKTETNADAKETRSRRRSSRTNGADASSSTKFVSRVDEDKHNAVTEEQEDESVLLRSAIPTLGPHGLEKPVPVASGTPKKKAETTSRTLVYEKSEETDILVAARSTNEATCAKVSSPVHAVDKYSSYPLQDGFVAKMVASGYCTSFLSVTAVVSSLVVSKFLPHDNDEGGNLWRRWLSFLTPIVALLLFFHQKDARASAKWIATGLVWRAAAELLVLIGATPRQFESMVAGSVLLANLSLVVAIISILGHEEHKHSNATLSLLVVGALALFLSDRYAVHCECPSCMRSIEPFVPCL